MRELTIKRIKAKAACLMKVKFYMADDDKNDLTIAGIKCRFLGAIKNGKEATFEISNDEQVIFAILDRFSKDRCNDRLKIAAGDKNITITGKNILSPVDGNPFIFDKNLEKEPS